MVDSGTLILACIGRISSRIEKSTRKKSIWNLRSIVVRSTIVGKSIVVSSIAESSKKAWIEKSITGSSTTA